MSDTELNLPQMTFITIAWDEEYLQWTLDLGNVSYWEARGVLMSCLEELETYAPDIRIRSNGESLDYLVLDDDDDDGESGKGDE